MSEGFSGGCVCGAVRFTSESPPQLVAHCHCTDCRKSGGAGHATHVIVAAETFSVSGPLSVYERLGDSGHIVSRTFCSVCGSPLFARYQIRPEAVHIRASSLDDPAEITPDLIVYASNALPWVAMDPTLPAFPEAVSDSARVLLETL